MSERDDSVGKWWDGPPPERTIFDKLVRYHSEGMSTYAAIQRAAFEAEAAADGSDNEADGNVLAVAMFGRVVLYAEANGITRAAAASEMLRAMAMASEPEGSA